MPEELGPEEEEMGAESSEGETNLEPEPQPRLMSEEEWRELWETTKGAKPGGSGVKQSRKVLLGDTWYEFFGGAIIEGEESISIDVPGKEGKVSHKKVSANDPRIRMVISDYGYYTYENLRQNPDSKPKGMF